jgi:PAS domain S-box-containing protein
MSELGSTLECLRDPRLSAHALSALPAWLWSADGTKILWANPTAAAILGEPSPADIIGRPVDPAIANQIANLATTMSAGAPARLARLRGFDVGFGRALTCLCSRIQLADRASAILLVATEAAGPPLSLPEQLRRLIAGSHAPIAFFSPEGQLLHGTPAAQARLGGAITLAALGAQALGAQAIADGRSSLGEITIARIGAGASIVLMASFAAKPAATVKSPTPPTNFASAPQRPQAAAIAPALPDRRQPLRFIWQMDADGRFTLGSDEFSKAVGPRTATALLDRPWHEIAGTLGLDPAGKVACAIGSRETWSAIAIDWPADDTDERLAVELSGFPVFDRDRTFHGYRGFGVCRDVARLAELMAARRSAGTMPAAKAPPIDSEQPKAGAPLAPPAPPPAPPLVPPLAPPAAPTGEKAPPAERPVLSVVPPSKNVVPFRSSAPADKAPGLSPVERRAFHEIARQLSSRLGIAGIETPPPAEIGAPPSASDPAAAEWTVKREPTGASPGGTGEREDAARSAGGVAEDEPTILDRLPVGVLLYRHDQLIHANRTFLDWTGYRDLAALAQAGGLERLFSEPGVKLLPESGAKSLAITTSRGEQLPVEGRLFAIPWERESVLALVLMLATAAANDRQKAAEMALRLAEAETRELRAILDTATDGVLVLDHEGHLLAGNRSAEALFGYESHELTVLTFAELFAPESQRTALDYLDGLTRAGVASILNDGREVIGRVRQGGLIPLFMTMGRIGDDNAKLCAVFRDITQWKKAEEELLNAKRQAEKTSSAKSEFLAKISHEIRTPLNSIIGFSEVMMEERFGPIGNERYKQYLKDIHSSGAHLVSLLNDLLDLSKIEAGKLELTFARVDLNEQVQQCVALMQPQANRERTIIRTSLAPTLPQVVADARSVRQIVLNLLSNSIKFTGAGGQVIVSTALSENGEVVLRVRDTGVGMSEQDIMIALEPFRQLATSTRWGSSGTGLGLPLTKALAEANRASFSITSRPNAGTLVEISFPSTRVLAE